MFKGRVYREYLDLTEYVDIDVFDRVMQALETVVQNSQSLALDNDEDRAELLRRLQVAVGAVP